MCKTTAETSLKHGVNVAFGFDHDLIFYKTTDKRWPFKRRFQPSETKQNVAEQILSKRRWRMLRVAPLKFIRCVLDNSFNSILKAK